jgi:hypothetical protein
MRPGKEAAFEWGPEREQARGWDVACAMVEITSVKQRGRSHGRKLEWSRHPKVESHVVLEFVQWHRPRPHRCVP